MSQNTALVALTNKLAAKFGMADSRDVMDVLKATAFKGQVSDAQMTALMVVANQYGLNPWTKEIYAFPDRNNGIVPVVGVDGWARIINEHPQFDGMDFEVAEDATTCVMYRKDRGHPIRVTEYLVECRRTTDPWKTLPKRMLRHKAMIQCARLAFGYVGIYDLDEAERILEASGAAAGASVIDGSTGEIIASARPADKPALPTPTDDQFAKKLAQWRLQVDSGERTVVDILESVKTRNTLTAQQEAQIRKLATTEGVTV